MSRADTFLARHGMEPERMDPDACTSAFLAHMERGLRGEPSSILMLPTYLTAQGDLPLHRPVIAIDAGGTHLRAALVTLTENGPELEGLRVRPMPGSAGPVSWEELIGAVADLIEPIAEKSDRISFCFSYPAEITPQRDGRVLNLTKQVKVTGSTGRMICASLEKECGRRNIFAKRFLLLNDTAATLMGGVATLGCTGWGGFVGLIYGTGVNTCCNVRTSDIPKLGAAPGCSGMLINLESGGFTQLPMGDMDRLLDASTADPGTCIYEKMVSGVYLGELMRLTLLQGGSEGLFSPAMTGGLAELDFLDTAQADAFCVSPRGRNPLALLCRTDSDREVTYRVLRQLADRAARLVCANLAAIFLLTGEGSRPDRPVCIMAEGAVLAKSGFARPMLERHLTGYLTGVLQRSWALRRTEHCNLVGSAAAALLNL